jgi:hypothetical protein
MRHILIPLGIAATIIGLLVATGQGNIDAGTFTYDAKDDRPALAETQNR